MRPQRRRAASTIAARVVSLATSASKARHSPPDCRAIATVSSAEARLLSTASTLAPSSAKRRTVARPLPMPSPGDWPAPTTIATLSLRRMPPPPRAFAVATLRHSGEGLLRGLDRAVTQAGRIALSLLGELDDPLGDDQRGGIVPVDQPEPFERVLESVGQNADVVRPEGMIGLEKASD